MPYPSRTIAALILQEAEKQGKEVDHLKLQKLLYFAHGIHLAVAGEPLLDEPIEAWRYGPVVRSVYAEYRSHGASQISPPDRSIDLHGPNAATAHRVIKLVVNTYGDRSGVELSKLSHASGSPWQTVYTRSSGLLTGPERIEDGLIRAYFDGLVGKSGAA